MVHSPRLIQQDTPTSERLICEAFNPVCSSNTDDPPLEHSKVNDLSLEHLPTGEQWSSWRGRAGDGHTDGLPSQWIEPRKLWRYVLPAQGIGGVSATEDFVAVSSRDESDRSDLFVVLDAESGLQLSELIYPSDLQLDYGNSPRVSPLITDDAVFCLGAQGWLHCLDLESNSIRWKLHFVHDLGGKLPLWGYSVSPMLVDGQLIVQPGGLESSWVALDPKTGNVLWKTNGRPPAYASPILVRFDEMQQLIGYDAISLGGWSTKDGRRLWEMQPANPKDFNVPTPLIVNGKIFVVTENNGARLYSMHRSELETDPFPYTLKLEASSKELSGDSHSPVRVGSLVVGVDGDLVVLDPDNHLREVARFSDVALQSHCTLMVDSDRIWISTGNGTQILLRIDSQIDSQKVTELGRFQPLDTAGEIYAHPALCNGVLYVRGPTWLDAYSLREKN